MRDKEIDREGRRCKPHSSYPGGPRAAGRRKPSLQRARGGGQLARLRRRALRLVSLSLSVAPFVSLAR